MDHYGDHYRIPAGTEAVNDKHHHKITFHGNGSFVKGEEACPIELIVRYDGKDGYPLYFSRKNALEYARVLVEFALRDAS